MIVKLGEDVHGFLNTKRGRSDDDFFLIEMKHQPCVDLVPLLEIDGADDS